MPGTNVTLTRREEIASATWAFTLGLEGRPFAYRPGQTLDLTVPNPPHLDAGGNRRTFSIAAAPGTDMLLVATRVRGSAFKRSLIEAPLGTMLEVEGPFGSFTLPNRPSSVVLLAGGIGVTPFRAMVEDAVARSLEHMILLIHSNRTPEETPFLDELQRWGKSSARFTYHPTMTRMDDSRFAWNGERRRISSGYLSSVLPRERDALLYYAAGPEAFVKAAVEALKAIGVDEDRIRAEEFPGY